MTSHRWGRPAVAGSGALVLALGLAWGSVAAGDATYRYVDQQGTIRFTDDAGAIPEAFRDRTQILEPVPPAEPPRAAPAPAPPPPPSWTSRVAGLSIPLPSRFQLGVGLTALALIIGALVALRASGSRSVRLGLKAGIAITLIASGYGMYLFNLNDRISALAREDAHPTTSGAVVLDHSKSLVDRARAAVERATEATVGAARRNASSLDQAQQDREHATQVLDAP